ncbi:MAG: Fe-S cluster assembly protein SufD [Proteobacteria bacterium]|nr:MAG: Fe-S cluster assembly protein SufD [Pseudomonadota bacterium]QKK12097.1 MAG: Fe-S cluster assembly protein SufD [Pseudomonadota bacterium]
MKEKSATERWQRAFGEAAEALPGAGVDWLRESRANALARFTASGFPTRRDEEWKYTGVSPVEQEIAGLVLRPGTVTEEDIQAYLLTELTTHALVFVDGHFSPTLSRIGDLPAGVTLTNINNLLEQNPERLHPHLAHDDETRWFAALNQALLIDGAYLELPSNTAMETPIHLLFVATDNSEQRAVQPRNLILVGAQSTATVVEHYVGLGGKCYLTNSVTDIVTGEGAVLHHYKVQQEGTNAYHIGTMRSRQAAASRFDSHSIALGGRIVRNDVYARLEQSGASCTLNGLFLGSGRQHIDNYTWVDHLVPQCTSSAFYKGILDDNARGVFNGRVYVHPDAQQTEAMQSNANLLLSRDAEIDTKPQLEIYADDVKCSHGATVGELDPTAIFYLQSRGIDKDAARSLLTFAFAGDLLRHIELMPLRKRLEEIVIARLPNSETVKDLL